MLGKEREEVELEAIKGWVTERFIRQMFRPGRDQDRGITQNVCHLPAQTMGVRARHADRC